VVAILETIHSNFQALKDVVTLPESPLWEDFEITVDSIVESNKEAFVEQMKLILETDTKLFFKMIELHGYDFWLEKVNLVGNDPQREQIKDSLSLPDYQRLKDYIEGDLCLENKSVLTFLPYHLRLDSKMQMWNSVKPDATEQDHLNYHSSALFHSNCRDIAANLSILEIRYHWALLKTFNKSFA
jgi:hypothetical protein